MSAPMGDILLVGSVPFDTVEEVLETCAGSLGARAFALPDGEIGSRKNWIQCLPELTYSKIQTWSRSALWRRKMSKARRAMTQS